MEPKRQSARQPNETAPAAGKTPGARKQSATEASTATPQGTSTPQGMAGNQGTTGNQGAGNPGMGNQGTGTQGGARQGSGEQDLMQHAKNAGGEIVNKVQEQAGSQLARGKESAANDLTQVVDAVRQFGRSLSAEQGGPLARYAAEYGDKAAQSLERLSTYIREQDAKQLLNDVQNFGRRRPALLLGGAFLLGFAGARLIKSSMNAAADELNIQGSQQSFHPGTPAPRPNVPAATPSTMPNAI